MIKKIILVFIVAASFTKGKACEICGCGVGGNYIGILPEFRKHILGFRYRFNSLRTHIGTGGNTTYLTSEEKYNTVDLWGGWNIGKRFRIMAAVPYSYDQRNNQGNSLSKNGIGDISINGFYQLVNTRQTIFTDKLLVQTLWIGGGIKLPTGKYTPADKLNTSQNTNLFQLGTASYDFSVNAMYDVRLQDFGVNVSASYKMNTANEYSYNYGNKVNGTAQVYYKFRLNNKYTIAPNVGAMYEQSKRDIDNKLLVDISGGSLLLGSVGIETSGNKISIGANWQTPLSQNLANGFVKANNRIMVHVSFIL